MIDPNDIDDLRIFYRECLQKLAKVIHHRPQLRPVEIYGIGRGVVCTGVLHSIQNGNALVETADGTIEACDLTTLKYGQVCFRLKFTDKE